MRFCSLKTYLSTWCQLISFHPIVFCCESILGLFTVTYTFSFDTESESRLHILGITPSFFWHYPLFRIRHWLLDPSFPIHIMRFDTYQKGLGMWWGYFVPTYHCFAFFRVHLSTDVNGLCVTKHRKFSKPMFCSMFRAQGVAWSTSLYPLLISDDGSADDSFSTPRCPFPWNYLSPGSDIERLLAVRRFQQLSCYPLLLPQITSGLSVQM